MPLRETIVTTPASLPPSDHAVHRRGQLLEAGRVHGDIGRLGHAEVALAGKRRGENKGRKQQTGGGEGKRGKRPPSTQSDHAWFLLRTWI